MVSFLSTLISCGLSVKFLNRIALGDITYDKLIECDPFSFPVPFTLATMPNVGPNEMTSPRY